MLTDTRKTAFKPLMMNFIKSVEAPTIEAEDYYIHYDNQLQISYHLGSGNSGGRDSTSQKGHRQTTDRGRYSGGDYNGVVYTHNDAPVTTDD